MKNVRINFGTVFRLLKKSGIAWVDDNAMRLSAALSYYSVFSIAPLLIIAIGIVGWVAKMGVAGFGPDQVQSMIFEQMSKFVGPQAAQAVQTMIESASKTSGSATIVGFAVLLVGASSVFGQLKDALNTIWNVRQRSGLGIWGFLRERLMSFGMVLVIGFLLLISLMLSVFIAGMSGWMQAALHMPKVVGGLFGFVLPLLVETALFGVLFRTLPDVKIPWRFVWLGSAVTALLFELGKTLLAIYLGQASTTSSFGAASSLVVLLLWVFYASCILFYGAEFTQVYAEESGAKIQPTEVAEKVPSVTAAGTATPVEVPAQPNPLHPDDPVPALPMKESLAPLLATTMVEPEVLRSMRLPKPSALVPASARQIPATGWEHWVAVAREHPEVQIGAAVGVGLLAGAVSRMFERHAPAMTAPEHFAEGSRKTYRAGRSLLALGLAWGARHLTRKALRQYADKAQEKGAHWSHEVVHRLEKAIH